MTLTRAPGRLSRVNDLIGLSLAGVILGTVLLVLGLRGRRVNYHPICRKCKFDLVGLWPGKERCPECGRALASARAIRRGARRRRPGLIILGAAILLPPVAFGAVLLISIIAGPGINPSKPLWLLSYEARHTGPGRAVPALTEITRRVNMNLLPDPAAVDPLIDEALARQDGPGGRWMPEWGDLILSARAAGRLDQERFKQFLRRAIRDELVMRPRARAGRQAQFTLSLGMEGAYTGMAGQTISLNIGPCEIDGQVRPPSDAAYSLGISPGGIAMVGGSLGRPVNTGRRPWRVAWTISVPGGPAPISWTEQRSGEIEVIPEGEPLVQFHRDPSLAEQYQAAIRPRNAELDQSLSPYGRVLLEYSALPYPVSLEVYFAWTGPDGKRCEQRIGEASLEARVTGRHGTGMDLALPPPVGMQEIEVVLRPSIDVAELEPDVQATWIGPDLVYPATPVNDRRPRGPVK